MEEDDQCCCIKKILDLALEIVYLLTREDNEIANKTPIQQMPHSNYQHGISPISVPPPPYSQNPEVKHKKQKILEVTKKMMELLTGEVPIRCQDVTVYFSMEEWEYLEGHKDLYKDVMMASQPALTSPGKRRLYCKGERSTEGPPTDGPRNLNPPEICPCPLDSTQEDLTILPHDKYEGMVDVNVEFKKEEEMYIRSKPTKEVGVMVIVNGEETSVHTNTAGGRCALTRNIHTRDHILPPEYFTEHNHIAQFSPEESLITQNTPHRLRPLRTSMNPSNPEESSYKSHDISSDIDLRSQSVDRSIDTSNLKESSLSHGRVLTGERPFLCSECGKRFTVKGKLQTHERIHTGERPYSCSECGKCFNLKNVLVRHQKIHTEERPFACSECGKCYIEKTKLLIHHRIHTGERPYSCSECGKCFAEKGKLLRHQKIHTGDRPHSCSECGKCFVQKGCLIKHQITHNQEKRFSCSECGKCFTRKGYLTIHQRTHNRVDSFSCSECGQCFKQKISLISHQSIHT